MRLTAEQIRELMGPPGPQHSYELVDRGLSLLADEVMAATRLGYTVTRWLSVREQLEQDLSESLERLYIPDEEDTDVQ